MTYSIRRAVADDIPQIFRISAVAHQLGYRALIPENHLADFMKRYNVTVENEQKYADAMRTQLHDSDWYVWVAEYEKTIKGYVVTQKIDDAILRVKELFVNPHYQGEGIGSALLKTVLDVIEADTIELAVLANNVRAKNFYAKNGLIVTSVDPRKPYYGVHREIMRLIKQ
jgi:ribosomal protein S18 acetylase RimI-like enzyme